MKATAINMTFLLLMLVATSPRVRIVVQRWRSWSKGPGYTRWIHPLGREPSKEIEATRDIAYQPEQDIHRAGLGIPSRLPARDGVRA